LNFLVIALCLLGWAVLELQGGRLDRKRAMRERKPGE
jgi:hypothetical protein